MRSVLTMALGMALACTCVLATGCANRRAMRSSRMAPASNMRLVRRAQVRAATPRRAVFTTQATMNQAAMPQAAMSPASVTDAYAPTAAPTWIDTTPGVTAMPDGSTNEILDPCGIAGNEHLWVDVTSRAPVMSGAAGPASDGVWMPASYGVPPSASPAGTSCATSACSTGACAIPTLIDSKCADGNCDLPGVCPDGNCSLPE